MFLILGAVGALIWANVDPDTLDELSVVGSDALFSIAVFVGQTRLIDNFLLQKGRWQVGDVLRTSSDAETCAGC